ncbi:hypothetical protein [Nocardia fluminea]|uniref:hypothetical protein n=1 Tax=Nocardia fluminea TaxID=134984 RepID=UPI003D1300FA
MLQYGTEEKRLQPFIDRLELFRSVWESWPRNWHQVGSSGPKKVSSARLSPDGLHVTLEGLAITIDLPLGIHALYESYAWCASTFFDPNDLPKAIPREAELFVYTWPIWILADILDTEVDQLSTHDIVGLMPLLLIGCCYHEPVLPAHDPRHSQRFVELRESLQKRDITTSRLCWQLLRDYRRFWSKPLTADNVDIYLKRIGVPPLSTTLELTHEIAKQVAEVSIELLNDAQDGLPKGAVGYFVDQFAEIDILQTTVENLEILRNNIGTALFSPLLLSRDLAPPVCATERPNGYEWFSATPFSDEPQHKWSNQTNSRILLREQLSMFEHILMQLAFGSHLACYGPFDWRLPINNCPATERCMQLQNKRGIEFCIDPAWRRKVAESVNGLYNSLAADPPEEDIPGISAATDEYNATVRRILEGQEVPPVTYDLSELRINFLR